MIVLIEPCCSRFLDNAGKSVKKPCLLFTDNLYLFFLQQMSLDTVIQLIFRREQFN
jgi:hypothetical protein